MTKSKDLLKPGPKGPTKYKKEMCVQVLELGRQGKSRAQIAAALGVRIQTIHNWERTIPEFLEATTWARDLSLAWWEDRGQEGLFMTTEIRHDKDTGRKIGIITWKINAQMWSLQVRNRFPEYYRDRSRMDHQHSSQVEHQDTRNSREVARTILCMLHQGRAENIAKVEHLMEEN